MLPFLFIVFFYKALDIVKIADALGEDFMAPIPPLDAKHGGNGLLVIAPADVGSGHAAHYLVRTHIVSDNGTCGNHRAVAYGDAAHNNGVMSYPYVVAYLAAIAPSPLNERVIIRSKAIMGAAVGEMVAGGADAMGMLNGVYAHTCCDAGKFAYFGIDNVVAAEAVGVSSQHRFLQHAVISQLGVRAEGTVFTLQLGWIRGFSESV